MWEFSVVSLFSKHNVNRTNVVDVNSTMHTLHICILIHSKHSKFLFVVAYSNNKLNVYRYKSVSFIRS